MKKKEAVERSGGRGVVKTVDGKKKKKTLDGICVETEWSEGLRDVKV